MKSIFKKTIVVAFLLPSVIMAETLVNSHVENILKGLTQLIPQYIKAAQNNSMWKYLLPKDISPILTNNSIIASKTPRNIFLQKEYGQINSYKLSFVPDKNLKM